jgi:hypothetical protein
VFTFSIFPPSLEKTLLPELVSQILLSEIRRTNFIPWNIPWNIPIHGIFHRLNVRSLHPIIFPILHPISCKSDKAWTSY